MNKMADNNGTHDSDPMEFSFANHAGEFEDHIHKSIRGYANLREDCIAFSQYFVEDETDVLDLGCSTGKFLTAVRQHNLDRAPNARYLGIDIESAFGSYWDKYRAPNLIFEKHDLRTYEGYSNVSFATSLFSLQFLPERERLKLVQRVYDAMLDGAGFVMAEKTFASSGKIQEMLTFMYYDFKRLSFSENEIMRKERSLRDKMKPWSEAQIISLLKKVGFREENIQVFWRNHLFMAVLAIKSVRA